MDFPDIRQAATDEEFQQELREMVADYALKLFALCEEEREREDGHVRYWGLAFDDCAEVISATENARARFRSVESACAQLSRKRKMHLIWAEPSEANPAR